MSKPAPYCEIGTHAVMPRANHDERARFDAIAHAARFLAGRVVPAVEGAYRKCAVPAFRAAQGHEPASRREAFAALEGEPSWAAWSSLRRHLMEMRQQAGRALVLRQADEIMRRVDELCAGASGPRLDPDFVPPRYLGALDQHCMPGGYLADSEPCDILAPANYDAGIYATTGGAGGRWSDGAGRAIVAWLDGGDAPALHPRRIVDLGCGIGHNTLPLARRFPDAEVIAIDAAAPMLRYGQARAASLGVQNVHFVQADAARTTLEPGSADLVLTTMVLHETSREAVPAIFRECARLLRPGGVTLHLEQPPFRGLSPFEQAMRDWDGRYNGEPFWTGLHETDLPTLLASCGFAAEEVFELAVAAPAEGVQPEEPMAEDYGRAARWYVVGARRS
jgi:SAM-dependent methyltransferase